MKYDLEERLIKFASSIIEFAEALPDGKSFQHLAGQLIRSGTAPALIYGEAQAAESRNDFIHKMKIGLKELRETSICLRIIEMRRPTQPNLSSILQENRELIAILTTSIQTAKSKQS